MATSKSAGSVPAAQPALSADMQRSLLARGDKMLQLGDVSAARSLYERVAEAGVPEAARKLANTYDPLFLQSRGLRGIKGDAAAAESWNRRAAELERVQGAQTAGEALTNAAR